MNSIIEPAIADSRTEGQKARDDAIDRVEAAADLLVYAELLIATHKAASELEFFTTDDVMARSFRQPREPRVLGSIMNCVKKIGVCVITKETENSDHVPCHHRPKRVWRSLIYQGGTSCQ